VPLFRIGPAGIKQNVIRARPNSARRFRTKHHLCLK
jgi:hypothetical protein